jgi:hypothetical protein
MLGRTSVRALSVLDVCSRYGQKQALEKTRAQIRETEVAILHFLKVEQTLSNKPRPSADIQPLLQDREKLYQRLAWLQLDIGSIAHYHASARRPMVKSDPIFVTRMAAYGYTIAPEYEAGLDTYDVLLAEGVLPQPPRVVLFAEPNYPAGQGTTVSGAVPNWAKPIGSLSVAPGSAVKLFSEPDFWGDWHVITTDIPNLYNSSRLNLKPGQPVGSLMVCSLCNLPYTGGWIISLEPGGYLSARQSEVLRVSPSAGPWETFRLDVVETLGRDRARVLLAVDNVTPSPEFVPDAVRSGGVYVLTEERSRGYRRFTLTDLVGRPVVLDNTVLRIGMPDQEPVLMTRAIKVAKNESEVGMLQLGEAALYEYANYWGRVWVVHETHSDFPVVAGLNDSVSSIRLGPYTGVTLYDLKKLGAGLTPEAERLDAELQRLRGKLRSLMAEPDWLNKYPDEYKELHAQAVAVQAEVMALAQKRPDPAVQQDITEDVPDLAESLSGANTTINLDNAASSIRLWRMFPPEEVNIEYTCKLSQDYRRKPDGTLEEIFAYRTTFKFDQSVEEVTIGATDATTIEIAGTAYSVDEDRSATVALPVNKQLVIITEARDICTPALKIRTSAMPEDARAVIYPDREAHQRLANLEPDELWEAEVREGDPALPSTVEPARKPLIDRSKFNKDQIANAQKAIQNAMSSIAYTEPGSDEVLASSRFVSARAARDAAWLLDFGTTTDFLVQPSSLAQPGEAAPPEPEELPIRRLDYQPLSDQQLGFVLRDTLAGSLQQGFWGWLKSAADFIWNKVIVAPVQYIWDHAKDFGEDVIDGLKEFGMAAWGALENFGDKLVAFLVNAAGEVAAFVLDTAEKVVAVVKTIVEKIAAFVEDAVEAIKKFIEFLAFLFNWGDILHTQEALIAMFNDFMTEGQTWIRTNRPIIKRRLKQAGDDFKRLILPGQADLTQDMEGDSFRMPSAVQETIKVVGEVQEKIDWVMDKVMNIVPGPQLQLMSISGADQAALRKISFSGSDGLVSTVGSVAEGVVDIFDDGLSPQQMLAGVLRLFATLMDKVIDGAIEFVDGLLEIAELLLRVLSNAFNHEWYIPILSEIYELLTDQDVTILSLISLILAIPLTVTTKIVIGERPFASGRPPIKLPDLSGAARVRLTSGLPGTETLVMPRAETGLPPQGSIVMASSEAGPVAAGDRAASTAEKPKDLMFTLATLSGLADTVNFLFSAALDAYPPDKEPKGGLATLFEFFELSSLMLVALSFMGNLPGSIVWDAFDEYEDKAPDVRTAAGFKWGIEAAMFLLDVVSASYCTATKKPVRRARRSEKFFWVTSIVLGIGHLTAVGCLCGMDDDMGEEEKAAECLMSIPGPLAILRYEGFAKNKYVWIGCAAILIAGNLGGAAGSIISIHTARP